jgi:hypothetical protein
MQRGWWLPNKVTNGALCLVLAQAQTPPSTSKSFLLKDHASLQGGKQSKAKQVLIMADMSRVTRHSILTPHAVTVPLR